MTCSIVCLSEWPNPQNAIETIYLASLSLINWTYLLIEATIREPGSAYKKSLVVKVRNRLYLCKKKRPL